MSPTCDGILGEVAPTVMNGTLAAWKVGPEASTESVSVYPTIRGTLSCSTNCFAVCAVTSILYWLSWTMKSIWLPLMPPAALISLTASFAPLAAGRSSADSSPVSAKPPPILIVPPLLGALPADVGAALVPAVAGAVDGALDPPELLHAATSAIMAAS